MTIFNIISLLGGLSLFLYGMRMMGDGLKHGSSGAFRRAMTKVTKSPLVGFLLGTAVTCLIQSSTATIVITSGLVGAGILTLHQSLGVIIGANVGTTITGQIIRLLDINADAASMLNFFKPSTLAPLAALIGIILIMVCKFRNSDTYGDISMGFGILFIGLLNMTAAVAPLSDSPAFAQVFVALADKPVLGFLAGAGVAFVIQSSSATVGILQALSLTGALTFSSIYAVIVGIYLGDCVTTAIVCSIGAKADAKRVGIVHILFNILEIVIIPTVIVISHKLGLLDSLWSAPITSGGIANTHTIFKLSTAVLFLPLVGLLEKLSRKIVKDDKKESGGIEAQLEKLDEKFYSSPALALGSAHEIIQLMAERASDNVNSAFELLFNFDSAKMDHIMSSEERIDILADRVSNYLIHLSPHVEADDGSDRLNYYLQCFSEFERIGDYAVNLAENAAALNAKETSFSPVAKEELLILRQIVAEITALTVNSVFADTDDISAKRIEPIEEVIDNLVEVLSSRHTLRLRAGICNAEDGLIFQDILTNAERIADQCSNVGVYTIGLSDDAVSQTHHDYLEHLHRGEDPTFNETFKQIREQYFSMLDQTAALQ